MTPVQIRKLREKHMLTAREFGDLLYVGISTVYSWEAGTRNMPKGLWELALIKLEKSQPVMPQYISDSQLSLGV